jgi:hypothetical protein
MPISMAPQVMSMRTASPILWPSVRLNPRWVAHRPLPSMTTATCLGIWSAGMAGGTALDGCWGGRRGPPSGDGGRSGNTTGQFEVSGKTG